MSAAELRRLLDGFRASQVIHAAAALGLADLIGDESRTSDELAAATEADPDTLYRLLRALAALGVFHEEAGQRFTLTELGRPLRTDAPDSVAGWTVLIGRPYYRNAWSHLVESVRAGENAFRLAYGTDVWEYRAQHPEEAAIFDAAMASSSRLVIDSLLAAYDFGRFGTIVDVGGGNGALLAALLAEYPKLRGVLFDQPQVVQGVDLGPRCEVVGGSFFDDVPDGGDAYVLKWIIHDWEDEESIAILRTIRRTGGTVLVIERLLGRPNEDSVSKLSDINMLVGPGGRERTLEEFTALFETAGYQLVGSTSTTSGQHVLEGVAGS
jgi:O-methyltransferase domain/Dimerisation domain